MVWTSLKNDSFDSWTASVRNLGPHNCQTQGYSGSQINWDTEISCGRLLMTWLPMMININFGSVVSGMCHCFKANLPYPLVLMQSSLKGNFLIGTKIHMRYRTSWNWFFENWNKNLKRTKSNERSNRGGILLTPDIFEFWELFWGYRVAKFWKIRYRSYLELTHQKYDCVSV